MSNRHYIETDVNFSRFAELSEMKECYTQIDYDRKEESANVAGITIKSELDETGNVRSAMIDGTDTNTIVVSSTAAGKTRRVLSPYVLSCIYAKHSFVIHDPKGELYNFFQSLLAQSGYEIRVLNFREPMKGDRLNVLQTAAENWRAGRKGRALEIAREVAGTIYAPIEDRTDLFWTESAINLFLCYFTIAAELYEPEYVTLSAIYHVHVEGMEKDGFANKIQIYLEAHRNEKSYELGMPSIAAPNDTRSSIYSVFSNGLGRLLLNEEIEDMLTASTFSIDDLASEKQPMALFLITRDEAPKTYATVVASVVDMIYTNLIDMAQKNMDRRLPRMVHFILEEFGNIARIENINDMLTASRSRGIKMLIVVQSLEQLYDQYSKEVAHILIGNAGNLVYMHSSDMELVKMISERCGNMMDPYTNKIRPLLSPDRLMHLDKKSGETLLLCDRQFPFITYLADISSYGMIKPCVVDFCEREPLELIHGIFAQYYNKQYEKKEDNIFTEECSHQENIEKEEAELSRYEMTQLPEEVLIDINSLLEEKKE